MTYIYLQLLMHDNKRTLKVGFSVRRMW